MLLKVDRSLVDGLTLAYHKLLYLSWSLIPAKWRFPRVLGNDRRVLLQANEPPEHLSGCDVLRHPKHDLF